MSYVLSGAPVIVAQCHCETCRRISGSGHTVGAVHRKEDVRVNGELGVFQYASDNGNEVTKRFCPACGSPILGSNTGSSAFVTIPLGTMDEAEGLAVQVAVFDACRQAWDEVADDIPRFPAQPDWRPGGVDPS